MKTNVILVLLIVSTLFNTTFSRSITYSDNREDVLRSIFADLYGGTESLPEVPLGAQRRIAVAPRRWETFRPWIPGSGLGDSFT